MGCGINDFNEYNQTVIIVSVYGITQRENAAATVVTERALIA
jgi:hypothetical protein